jgi:hypothetical protein
MSAASNYLELKVLDHALGTTAYTKPTAVYVALFTADPGEAGSFAAEISATGTAYARQEATFAAASGGSAATNDTITFPTAGANWGTITHLAICDSATRGAGNVLFYGAVTTSKVIETGDTFQITSGNLTVSLD